MAEAEYLLPERQRNAESVLPPSVNGEERVPSPVPPEKTRQPPSFTVDPRTTHNGYEPHPVKTPAALHSNKNQACKKKKKCLSDIFGHMIGESKETSVIKVADQFHTTACALKKEDEDSPYADLESVPMLHRPKRAAVPPVQAADGPVRKEDGCAQVRREFTDKSSHSTGSSYSPGCLTNSLTSNHPEESVSCSNQQTCGPSKMHSATFPASSGLMTRALKAEGDADLSDAQATRQTSTHIRAKLSALAAVDVSTKTDNFASSESPSSAPHSSPKRRARKPDKKQIRNGSLTGSRVLPEPVKIKAENVPQPVSSSSPSVSPVDALQDVKELMFKSLVKEESSSPDLSVFRPDANYKFSTFLMLLKDMHDTREKEGKPLTLPPSPVLIKEEPLVIPAAAGGDLGSCDGLTQGIKVETGQAERATVLRNSRVKPKKRTKPIMSSESYNFQDFPTNCLIENLDKRQRKRRLPAKIKPVIPGLSSDLANLAYGREYVTGHADLAGPSSCPPGVSDTSANYLDKNCGASTVAPKKRWQMVEDDDGKSEVKRRGSLEMNGSFITASPDLHLEEEKQGDSGSFFSETSYSSAGEKKKSCCFTLRGNLFICCGWDLYAFIHFFTIYNYAQILCGVVGAFK